jgi:uncharacterized protein YkwD
MTRVRAFIAVIAVLLPALNVADAASAQQDVVDVVNAIRVRGCGGKPAVEYPLRRDDRLDRAAAALAAGENLKEALQSADYHATQAALLEASGDAESIGRVLAGKGCKDILEPAYRDIGFARGGRTSWILLAAPLVAPAAGEASSVNSRVLALVNEARRQKRRCGFKRFEPSPPLAASATLQRAAKIQAEDMARRGVMEHAGGDGSTPAERATRAGYAWRTVGENVAAGQSTPEQVVEEWPGSPRHCANIMSPDYTEMGVAVASSAAGVYWAQVFGAPAP